MAIFDLVYLQGYLSRERLKYIWEDFYGHTYDETIGRILLQKAHGELENKYYRDGLKAFNQALVWLKKKGVKQQFYYNALHDKALILCKLGRYKEAMPIMEQALTLASPDQYMSLEEIRKSHTGLLILNGDYAKALEILQALIKKEPEDDGYLRFNMATCLLRLERYEEAAATYEQCRDERDTYIEQYIQEGLMKARYPQLLD